MAGSLLVPESRKIAALLLGEPDEAQWNQAILSDNVLQKRSLETARRQARLIRHRLSLMNHAHWTMVKEGSLELTTQALLAAAIKHSRLLGDFMDKVIRDCHRTFIHQLNKKHWEGYLDLCKNIDPALGEWTERTQAKLGQVVFRILAEGKYIDSTRSKNLLPVLVSPQIRDYLSETKDQYVLRCMEVNQQ